MSAPQNIQSRLATPETETEFTCPDTHRHLHPEDKQDKSTIPDYLSDAYWWAYLAGPAVWFFDHQLIINAILLGQYRRIMRTFIGFLDPAQAGTTLQLAAVYGELTPSLARHLKRGTFHLIDVAPVQLRKACRKLVRQGTPVSLERMNAEALGYASNSFDTVLIYFLLHELPKDARERALHEALRVLRPGGKLLIAEYGELERPNVLHRLALVRTVFEHAEPYLHSFWSRPLDAHITAAAGGTGKTAVKGKHVDILGGFYGVTEYRLEQAGS
ncbi:MAG TPA: rhodoquinone biosynthesis methyltransferase RquA [Gammaproteobacteria bacterium]|nr:rhodoquinone biosynthesis methyltransferase RquA [Gammaproteobacteria bacterium]